MLRVNLLEAKPMNIIEKAIEVAAKAHVGQVRKLSAVPYISHPFTVGMILQNAGYSDEIICAGILHDTVEDTELTHKDIEELFGEKIATLVAGATEPEKAVPWEERKEHTIASLKNASKDICVVVCADKIHNLRTMKYEIEVQGSDIWNRFARGKEKQEWYYREVLDSISNKLEGEPLLEQLKYEFEAVFR